MVEAGGAKINDAQVARVPPGNVSTGYVPVSDALLVDSTECAIQDIPTEWLQCQSITSAIVGAGLPFFVGETGPTPVLFDVLPCIF